MPQALREPANQFLIICSVAFAIIMACAGVLLYWAAVDTQSPMTGVAGTFKGWDERNPNVARVEWTGQRFRYCDAKIDHWFINNGKPVVAFQTERIVDGIEYTGNPGEPDTIYDSVEIPPEIKSNLINPKYRVRFKFSCNGYQTHYPLIVAPPEISLLPLESSSDASERVTDSKSSN